MDLIHSAESWTVSQGTQEQLPAPQRYVQQPLRQPGVSKVTALLLPDRILAMGCGAAAAAAGHATNQGATALRGRLT
jgi:hypothetical protein